MTAKTVSFTLLTCVVALFVLEGAARLYFRITLGEVEQSLSEPLVDADGVRPSVQVRHKKTVDGEVIFDVLYAIDSDGWRPVAPAPSPHHKNHLALFGCSHTFGLGLSNDATLGTHFARNLNQTSVYNFAAPATGPNFALKTIQEMSPESISPPQGKAIFLLNSFHYRRIYPDLGWYRSARSPKYRIKEGRLQQEDYSAFERRYHRSAIFLSDLSIVPFVERIRRVLTFNNDVKLMTFILKEMALTYEQKFPHSKFYVVLNWKHGEEGPLEDLVTELKKENVPFLDLSKLIPVIDFQSIHAAESHPSESTMKRLSEVLIREMKL